MISPPLSMADDDPHHSSCSGATASSSGGTSSSPSPSPSPAPPPPLPLAAVVTPLPPPFPPASIATAIPLPHQQQPHHHQQLLQYQHQLHQQQRLFSFHLSSASPAPTALKHPLLPLSSASPVPAFNPGGTASSDRHSRDDCWSEGATVTLIHAWGDRYLELNRGNLKQKHWKDVADSVNRRVDGSKPPKTDIQCKNRLDTLKKKYKLEKSKIVTGGGPSKWAFFDRLDELIGPSKKPKKPMPVKLRPSLPLLPPPVIALPAKRPFEDGDQPPQLQPLALPAPNHCPSPTANHATPNHAGSGPNHVSGAPNHVGSATNHVSVPHYVGSAPNHVSSAPHHVGSAANHVTNHVGCAPNLRSAAPNHVGSAPHHASSTHVGSAPHHVSSTPNHVGSVPNHAGSAPNHVASAVDAVSKSKESPHTADSCPNGEAAEPKRLKRKRPHVDPMQDLAQAIIKFGEVYERTEINRQQTMAEIEKQRMIFMKDLELQRLQFFTQTQVELAKLRQSCKQENTDHHV